MKPEDHARINGAASSDEELNDPKTGLSAILLRGLEERLKVPQGYILSLRDEGTDWEYIVKLALLVEAALTEYIVAEIGRPEVYEHISNSEQSKRLTLAVVLELITEDDRELLLTVAEVRNAFAHRVVNLHRTLEEYLLEQQRSRLVQIAKRILGKDGVVEMKKAGIDLAEWVPSVFRTALINAAVLPLISMSMSRHIKERDEERKAWKAANPNKELAKFSFTTPVHPDLHIGPSPDGKPGPGLNASPEG
jgi:hypothetical protein